MITLGVFARRTRLALAYLAAGAAILPAQTPPPPAKRLPPAGLAIPAAARTELTAGAATLRGELEALARELANAGNARLAALLPDAEVFHKAVDWALRHDEFFDVKQIEVARRYLITGRERVAQLRGGRAPWLDATGLVLRGHRSKLDGSVQPYGLLVPPTLSRERPNRLQVWLLGRGDKRTELAFLAEREAGPPQIVPHDTLVLVPYGRFCNATKFAGEVDVFEAMAAVRETYRIDDDRIAVAGFSMGGASTWHLATHHPGLWAAASPGAGFAETAVYNKALAPGKPARTPWEQKLWRWYDATEYAANLSNLPLIAYSGELDPQIQSADLMEAALAREGLKLERLIGPQTAHKYHPDSRTALIARLDTLLAAGRPPAPAVEHFTTYTLRYAASRRITIMELEKSWERADVHLTTPARDRLEVTTKNVGGFTLRLERTADVTVAIDGQPVPLGQVGSSYWFAKSGGRWQFKDSSFAADRWGKNERKVPGLSGPIDDAFMEPFLFVRPTGRPLNPALGQWTAGELAHAAKMWREIFRGNVLIKDDAAVTDDDLANRNLILWGDVSSNRLITRVLATGKLPLTWNAQTLAFRGRSYAAAHHAPVLVFPNPLSSRKRYVVLNSGIDFRNEAYGTNSLQTPKLPDFAIIDLREPPGPRWPGKIADAGFFDETWK